jgi:FkbM family methyltransferase
MSAETVAAIEPYGACVPGSFDRAVIAVTRRMPDNWLGMRLAILMRRMVTMRLVGDSGVDVERWGLRLRLHPRRNGCEKGLLFTPQFFEARERAELAARIDGARAENRPFTFVDIGANVGLFSFFVAARAGENARIVAVEPEPENVRRLRFNVEANGGLPIRVLPHALGEAAGSLALELHPTDRGGTRTRPPDGSAVAAGLCVECKTLIDILSREDVLSIDALKNDVEGAEDRILEPFFAAAPESLWPRFMIIEDTHELWRDDLFAILYARGYRTVARTRLNVMMER